MAKVGGISKRVAIDKANTQTVIVVAIASFITIFCLMASNTLLSNNSYQQKVIDKENVADKQLKSNISAYNQLTSSYANFVSPTTNAIGGQSSGTGSNDGDNAVIVLDALPPSYDFPGLTSTVEKILKDRGFSVSSISGTDDQVNQQNNSSSANPQPVNMAFSFTVDNTNYSAVANLITVLQQSIRPIYIDNMQITGGGNTMTLTVNAHTFYQPAKSLQISKQVVK
jgi:hypothetical protein